MHTASLLGEQSKAATEYGWSGLEGTQHNWEKLRESVQDHIRGLNFGYRVQLREQGVTYLNKLGKFVGPNTLECTDAKGKVQTITGARFVIATGGRPTPLTCPGGEFALTSDDIFMKETAPGRTRKFKMSPLHYLDTIDIYFFDKISYTDILTKIYY